MSAPRLNTVTDERGLIMKEKTATRILADELGISYHHNANDATIKKLIDAHREENPTMVRPPQMAPNESIEPMTEEEWKAKNPNEVMDKRRQCARLIRCRIQNLNPAKKEWPGEIISVGSAKLGTFKKFVPFNTGEPYHLPKIIFDVLKDKQCTFFKTEKDDRGNNVRKGYLSNEYALEVLDPLTAEELEDLKKQQALAKANYG